MPAPFAPASPTTSPKAENYLWSSAARAAHCGLRPDPALTASPSWRRQFDRIGKWSAWLAEGDEPDKLDVLRHHADKGLPCGSARFILKLEKTTGRALQFRPWDGRGRSGMRPQWRYLKAKASDYIVIPAKAGIQGLKKHRPIGRFWMPAFAGMTEFLLWGA